MPKTPSHQEPVEMDTANIICYNSPLRVQRRTPDHLPRLSLSRLSGLISVQADLTCMYVNITFTLYLWRPRKLSISQETLPIKDMVIMLILQFVSWSNLFPLFLSSWGPRLYIALNTHHIQFLTSTALSICCHMEKNL